MRDLQQFYMRLASSLERAWTRRKDKVDAAILLRNHAIETPHCHFCGVDAKGAPGTLYDSRYNPKARICRLCALQIAAALTEQVEGQRETAPGPRRTYDDDYRRDGALPNPNAPSGPPP